MSNRAQQFALGLKSRNIENRCITARELYHYVKTELRELSPEVLTRFLDEFNQYIHEMLSSSDVNEKKGAILAIVCLIGADTDTSKSRTSRYANYLRNVFPSSDVGVMDLAARAVGRLAVSAGVKRAEYVEFEIKRAFEWIGGDHHEGKKHAAALILKELAIAMPTYFYQHISGFFDNILILLKDPKVQIREAAAKALRAGLVVTVQRESSKKSETLNWYGKCFFECKISFVDLSFRLRGLNRDDSIHGALLILNELLRCSNASWEKKYTMLMQQLNTEQDNVIEDIVSVNVKINQLSTGQCMGGLIECKTTQNQTPYFYESAICRKFILENYRGLCADVIKQLISRSPLVHQILLIIIPRLAALNREVFVKKHLKTTINHLITFLHGKEKDKVIVFTTLGLMAVAVKDDIKDYIARIMDITKLSLPTKDTPSKKRSGTDPAIFICITLLGSALKEDISSKIKELLEPMCAVGLNLQLTICLKELSESIPSLKKDITEKLLNMLSIVLRKKPYLSSGEPVTLDQKTAHLALLAEPHDAAKLVLALRTLGTFDFDFNSSLLSFIKRCTSHYLQNEQREIRLETVRTTAKLLLKIIHKVSMSPSRTLSATIDEAVGKLLVVAVTDPDYEVRYWVLQSLNEKFDPYLSQVEHLRSIFVTLNDEHIEIRELAICIIGRLSTINPAYIMPSLRKILIQFLTEMEHSGLCRNKEEAARMLDNLILYAPRLVRPYVDTILNVLVPKLKESDSSSNVIIGVLKAIGDLADVNGDWNTLNKWTPELISIQLNLLSNSTSPEKRSVALWAFGQLISATGHVVTPYKEYGNLMDILLNYLRTEQQLKDRRETIRVLGILGALDPYTYKMNKGLIDFEHDSKLIPISECKTEDDNFNVSVNEMLVNKSNLELEEFYPAIVIATLMHMLRDQTLVQHHTGVVQALIFVFQSLGIKSVPYISQIMPSLLLVIRTTDNNNFRDFLLSQIAKIVDIVKQHIRNYLDGIFDLIKEFWTPDCTIQPTLIQLLEHIAVALGSEFKAYLPQFMPQILRVLCHDSSKDRFLTEHLLYSLQKFQGNLEDYLHMLMPPIVKLFEAKDCSLHIAKLAMETVDNLSLFLNFNDLMSRIIHPLVRVLDTYPSLRSTAMDTLCALVIQIGRKYNDFIPLVEKVMIKHKIRCQNYEVIISKLQLTSSLAVDDNFLDATRKKLRIQTTEVCPSSSETSQTIKRLTVNANNLCKSWAADSRVSKDDWLEWLRRLGIGLLQESHSPALRACSILAHNYPQLASNLFNVAFVSCWTELGDNTRKDLVEALEQALVAQDVPELAHAVLNLAEFMEHCECGALPLSVSSLGNRAICIRAYAKALYYKEEEYRNNPTSQVVEALIHINNKLQGMEAAEGLLEKVMTQKGAGHSCLNVQVRWYEKLHNWEKALLLYDKKLEDDPDNSDSKLGQMRCLEALGEWGKLCEMSSKEWPNMTEELQKKSAKLAATAAWGLNQWESMKKYVNCLPDDSQDGSFYRAVLAIRDGQWTESRHYIERARTLLDSELTAVAGESYQRAYCTLINAQLLAELEEVVTYKLVSEKRDILRHTWWVRLQGVQSLVEDWRRILQVRSLVLTPHEDLHTWIKFSSLCRKSGVMSQARNILVMLIGCDPSNNPDLPLPIHEPRLTLAYAKHLWAADEQHHAFNQLQRFVENSGSGDLEHCRLLARCHLKLGLWCENINGINELSIPQILRNYAAATVLAPNWYKAWHAWAYMNFETVLFYKQQDNNSESSLTGSCCERKTPKTDFLNQYTVPAVEGFFKSINLSHGSSLQDTLRLLTLWFEYGHNSVVYEAITEGIKTIEINVWLQVIPQLIARIDTPRPLVAKVIHSLLIDIGKCHPQALVYPLTVASNSSFAARKSAANEILKSLCIHSSTLVSQAAIISEELNRAAILWHEQWSGALEEASRLFYSEKDIKGMIKTLEPLHAMLEKGPHTLKEISFHQAYGRELREAQECCNRFKDSGNRRDINQAWDLYYQVFRRITVQLRNLTSLELQYVSPRLLHCRDLELAVPGSYTPQQELIKISHIQSNLQVITSKQRPRRLTIRGSDGKDYMFLLKGHEDLRQDERVMQLFGLVNTLLQNDPTTFRCNLNIQRYAIIPLSTNSGLIGWVPNCDTLYNLIKEYRDKKIPLNTEQQIMLRMASDFPKLMLMQKVELFEHALEQTPGNDLARLLWLKSPSAEAWFERRTNYTRSLAVMSMVGYILGLGDRHPSNIMLHRATGKVLHIDFGDCFEVTLTRDKFPEKIPFRLTRMLINAMEVTGIEGTYRCTCESVMEVLHKHKDSVMAVLEAFVYDPLLSWRLVETGRHSRTDASLGSTDNEYPSSLPSRSRHHIHLSESVEVPHETNLNKRALAIVNRIRDKLTGHDFPNIAETVSVKRQVELLIQQATNNENLCQCYVGWCPFW